MSTEDVLTAIDHALDDWSVSGCAMRWTPEPVTAPRQQGRAPLPSGVLGNTQEEVFAAFGEAIRRVAEVLAPVLDEVRCLAGIRALNEAWLLPDEGPTEPRARALWIRQTRNTGPSRDLVHQRRPRRLT